MKKKALLIFVVALSLPGSIFAADAKKPVSEWTCQDYLLVEDTYKPQAIIEAIDYSKKMNKDMVTTDVIGEKTITPEIMINECTKNPKESFWTKVKEKMDKIGKEIKDEAKKVEKKL
jgi:acid stress chaperone HdeA